MSSKQRRISIAQRIGSRLISRDDSNDTFASSQNSQNSRSKNYSAEESAALIRCAEKFYDIITKNSSRDKDKQIKQRAWESIKKSFDQYCKSQGIYVSKNSFFMSFRFEFCALCLNAFAFYVEMTLPCFYKSNKYIVFYRNVIVRLNHCNLNTGI